MIVGVPGPWPSERRMTREPHDSPVDEALRWFVLLHDCEATDDDRRSFAQWLARGPEQKAAWDRACHVWREAGRAAPALRPGHSRPVALSRRRWLTGAGGAALAATVGYAVIGSSLFVDHRTGVGERRTVSLPDGSTVELGSATALSVGFSDARRDLTLHHGEAFFAVSPDAQRPFTVAAANGRTEALGTAFDVKHTGGMVVVSVAEHRVRVAADGLGEATAATGQQVRYSRQAIEPARAVDLSAVQAWRRNRLVFDEAPLGEVMTELERYRYGRILIASERIAALTVTAVIDVAQADALLDTIAKTLPVRVLRATDLLVVITDV